MTLYKRGATWWYEFEFRGQRIRESSRSRTKSIAERIERERRRQLELGSAGLKEHRSPQMFSVASRHYLHNERRRTGVRRPSRWSHGIPIGFCHTSGACC